MITEKDGISLFSKLDSNLFEKKTKGQIWKLKANTVLVKGREDLPKMGLKSQHCTLECSKRGFTKTICSLAEIFNVWARKPRDDQKLNQL